MLNFLAPVNITSYGITGYNLCKAMHNMNIDFALFPVPSQRNINFEPGQDSTFLQKYFDRAGLFDPEAPSVRLWHQHSLDQFVGRGLKVGFPIFELDTFNARELHHLKNVDALFVPSQWAKQVVNNNNIKVPTYVVPLGVDTNIFYERMSDPNAPYTFLHIGKLEKRKGHDFICDVFNKAFTAEDNVRLVMAVYNFGADDKGYKNIQQYYMSSQLGRKISFVERLPSQNDVAALISQSDCMFQPSRAEGWDLPLIEGMACNKPCIATNYSAHTEFCNKDNSYLVDIKEVEKAEDGKYFFGQGSWAKIGDSEKDQMIEYMRSVYKNNIRSNPIGLQTAREFSWTNSVTHLIQSLQDLSINSSMPYQPTLGETMIL